jgi:hypothetical protein
MTRRLAGLRPPAGWPGRLDSSHWVVVGPAADLKCSQPWTGVLAHAILKPRLGGSPYHRRCDVVCQTRSDWFLAVSRVNMDFTLLRLADTRTKFMRFLVMTSVVFSQIAELRQMHALITELKGPNSATALPDEAEYWSPVGKFTLTGANKSSMTVNVYCEDSDITAAKQIRESKGVNRLGESPRPNWFAIHAIFKKSGDANWQYRKLFSGGRVRFDKVSDWKSDSVTFHLRSKVVVYLRPGESQAEIDARLRKAAEGGISVKKIVIRDGVPALQQP